MVTQKMVEIEHAPFALRFALPAASSLAGIGIVAVFLACRYTRLERSDLGRVTAVLYTIKSWGSVLLFITAGAGIPWHRVP